jgi:hypothetical protein
LLISVDETASLVRRLDVDQALGRPEWGEHTIQTALRALETFRWSAAGADSASDTDGHAELQGSVLALQAQMTASPAVISPLQSVPALDTWVFSVDKDLMQLVSSHTKMISFPSMVTSKRVRTSLPASSRDGGYASDVPYEFTGVSEVSRRFDGCSPVQVPHVLALMGDESDDIPGVEGVGAKTAAKLIHAHGSVGAVYGLLPLPSLSGITPRVRSLLAAHPANAWLSLALTSTQIFPSLYFPCCTLLRRCFRVT